MTDHHDRYELSDDLSRVDLAAVHAWLAETYWSPGIDRETVERGTLRSAVVVGAYERESGRQVGFLRVVSDTTRFAWICDVYVDSAHRSRGIAKAMVSFALKHPQLVSVSRWLLATRDAQDVYRAVGFEPLPEPARWMQLRRVPADRQEC